MTITRYKQNDRLPEYTATLVQGTGTTQIPIDLTALTVSFIMRLPGAATPKVDAAATVVSAAAGTVKYAWATGNLDTVGAYEVEWEILYSGSRTLTVPAGGHDVIIVVADLDTP